MSEQAEIETPERPEKPPFQFGLKHLLAAPVLLALFLSIATTFGIWWAAQAVLLGLTMIGLCFRQSRNIAAAALLIWMAWLLLQPAYVGHGASPRSQCANNLKQIVIALHNYHDVHGSFPPAYIADENGRSMHSWRVLILPYLERSDIYRAYDFSEPWNGPNNTKLGETVVHQYSCPAGTGKPSTMTGYVTVVGPGTPWPGSQPTRTESFTDGSSNTLLVVEVADSGIHWMEPRDLHVLQMAPTINPSAGQGLSSPHPGGANVALADGHVCFLPEDISPEDLRAILTVSGGESVDLEGF